MESNPHQLSLVQNHQPSCQMAIAYQPTIFDLELTPIGQSSLSNGHQVALWCFRYWLRRQREPERFVPLSEKLEASGLQVIEEVVDEMMSLLARSALRPVIMECTCTEKTSSDELRILRSLKAIQEGRIAQAQQYLRRLLPENMARLFCRPAEKLIESMQANRLVFGYVSNLAIIRR